jgi:hypothetical protein
MALAEREREREREKENFGGRAPSSLFPDFQHFPTLYCAAFVGNLKIVVSYQTLQTLRERILVDFPKPKPKPIPPQALHALLQRHPHLLICTLLTSGGGSRRQVLNV